MRQSTQSVLFHLRTEAEAEIELTEYAFAADGCSGISLSEAPWVVAAGRQMKQAEEGGELKECSFAPKTGRGPVSGPKATIARLPPSKRLYANHGTKYMQVETAT